MEMLDANVSECLVFPVFTDLGDVAAKGWLNVALKHPYLRAADIAGDFVPVTGPCGKRVYATTAKADHEPKTLANAHQSTKGLVSNRAIDIALGQAEQDTCERVGNASETSRLLVFGDVELHPGQNQLWVDKYAPKLFTELLSDEQINREVLRWLKQWDPCVFGRKPPCIPSDSPPYHGLKSHASKRTKGTWSHDQSRNYGVQLEPACQQYQDRPQEKILLLSGPPGLGKTTLAHVAARHCGYHVVEVNASDDRFGGTGSKILDCLQVRSVVGDSKPICLIIDEIDGSLGGAQGLAAMDSLLKIISADAMRTEDRGIDANQSKGSSGRKRGSHTYKLSRPVICICNDLYAPALRNLRRVARIHKFLPPNGARVVTRLKQICSIEGYQTNSSALAVLADNTDCDIRSCLHTLQFLHQNKKSIQLVGSAAQVIGKKNSTHNIFNLWKEVFQSGTKPFKAAVWGATSAGGSGKEQREFQRLAEVFGNHGDFDLGFEGVYENLANIRFHDSSMQKLVECINVLGDSDILSRRIVSQQHFFLNAYQSTKFLAVRRLVSQPDFPHLSWPRLFQSSKSELNSRREMLRDWLLKMSVGTQRIYGLGDLVLDLISPLLAALSPGRLRPVADQLLSEGERKDLQMLVGSMVIYGITYKRSRASGTHHGADNSVFSMDPPIDNLITFQNHVPLYSPLSSSLRQILSHKVEMEGIRLRAASRVPEESGGWEKAPVSSGNSLKKSSDKACAEATLVDKAKGGAHTTLDSVPAQNSRKRPAHPVTNMFQRFKKSEGDKTVVPTVQRNFRPVIYKYHEGFTSAVKRPMLVRDFLKQ